MKRFTLGFLILAIAGCDGATGGSSVDSSEAVVVTPSSVRAERRLYDGAPPVVPHPVLGADCTTCHTETGKAVPRTALPHLSPVGAGVFAPANPHHRTRGMGEAANCRQCHVFQQTDGVFAENSFEGIEQDLRKGDRLYAGAPPVLPHPLQMRENCVACHTGPAARPEIRCSHPERLNCRQCHMLRDAPVDHVWASAALKNQFDPDVDSQDQLENTIH